MALRPFTDQRTTWERIGVYRRVSWLELRCPECSFRSYVTGRWRPLPRTGSRREYVVCPGCGISLCGGKVEHYPRVKLRFLRRLFPRWRREYGGSTTLRPA